MIAALRPRACPDAILLFAAAVCARAGTSATIGVLSSQSFERPLSRELTIAEKWLLLAACSLIGL
jgi:hypothetical protein